MKTILCYGDSNTWGYVPGSFDFASGVCQRFSSMERWTGLLQNQLGEEFAVVECGLNGRTSDLDEPGWPNRNGLVMLDPILEMYTPVDLVILMLGTNDLKCKFARSAHDIAAAMKKLIDKIKGFKCVSDAPTPTILIVSPPAVTREDSFNDDFKGAIAKNKMLPAALKGLCEEEDCFFLDASEIALSPEDGVHLELRGHLALSELVGNCLREICKSQKICAPGR